MVHSVRDDEGRYVVNRTDGGWPIEHTKREVRPGSGMFYLKPVPRERVVYTDELPGARNHIDPSRTKLR